MPIRYLGYACVNQTLRGRGKDQTFTSRSCTLKTFDKERASHLALQNAYDLLKILNWNAENKINFFRVGSDLFPFATHPDVGYEIESLKNFHAIKVVLEACGTFARNHGMRLNAHPGPTTLLASPRPHVIDASIRDIELHCQIARIIGDGADIYNVNFHVGGPYGDKVATAKRFCENFPRLSEDAQKRITIENDDKITQYTVDDLHRMIWQEVGIPIVFDYHHHVINPGEDSAIDAMQKAFETWADERVPEIHYSEPRDGLRSAAHADYIHGHVPDLTGRQYDVMIEAKAKELALLKYREAQQKFSPQVAL